MLTLPLGRKNQGMTSLWFSCWKVTSCSPLHPGQKKAGLNFCKEDRQRPPEQQGGYRIPLLKSWSCSHSRLNASAACLEPLKGSCCVISASLRPQVLKPEPKPNTYSQAFFRQLSALGQEKWTPMGTPGISATGKAFLPMS